MKIFGKKLVSLIAIFMLFFPFLSVPLPVYAAGSCLCGVQDLTKIPSTSHVYKSISVVTTKEKCGDALVQDALDNTKQKLHIASCVWQESGAKTSTIAAVAVCKCKTGEVPSEITASIPFSYPTGLEESEKGKWFAIAGQKFCSSKTTAQKSCVFYDTAYGSGNIQSAKTPISTYANELNKLGTTDIPEVIATALKTALGVAGSISFALFVYAGVLLMSSGGNSERTTKAKQTMVWATLGVFIIFASYAIISFIFEAVK